VVLTPDTTPPTAPPNLSGGSDNPTTASLSWNESTDNVGVAGYYVFRNGVQIATTALLEPGASPVTVIYQDSGLTEATNYTYTVEAFDLAGNVSPASAPITITTTDVTPPTTPTNLAAAAAACTRVTLTWTASTDKLGISNYKIFAGLSPSSMIQIGMQGPSPTSYNDQTVSPGTTYYYALQAVDTSGNLSYMTTPVPINTPALPVAPAGVTATPNSGTKVTVKWSPSTGGMSIAHYNVFRGNSATSLVQYAQTTGTTYNDMAATPSTTYYYAVQASDTGSPASQSGLSAPVVSATTYPLPGPPTNVTAVGASTTRITLSWTAPVTPGGLSIANYRIFRGPSSTNLTQITTVTKSPYNDQNLTPNTTYYYGIEAVDTGVPADVGTMSTPVAGSTYGNPNPPTNVAAAPASSSKITVTWAAAVPNGLKISNYHVYGGASCSSLTQLGITTALTYNQMSLSPDTTYYYAVQATDTGGDVSAMSTCVSATTYPLPTTPSNVTATAKSTTMMSVSWSASTGSLTIKYYYVSRGLTPTSLSQVATTSNLSFTDQNLTPGTTYYYSIQASDTAGDRSASSPPVAGTTNP
jgi:fibronectin type 3 domain-containing protein